MYKRSIVVLLAISIALAGCGEPLVTKQREYPTYGFFNEDTDRSNDVCYKLSVGNIVWSIILIETIFMPIYFIGFSLFNPVRLKTGPDDKCSFDA